MKRFFAFILTLCMIFSFILTSCDSEDEKSSESSTTNGTSEKEGGESSLDSNNQGGTDKSDVSNDDTSEDDSSSNIESLDKKYDYDMTKYITIPDLKDYSIDLSEDSVKQAISNYLLQSAKEYTVKRGDKVYVELKFYEQNPDIDKAGEEIAELSLGVWLKSVALEGQNGDYQIGKRIEEEILNEKISNVKRVKITLDDTFFEKSYVGQTVYVDIEITNKEVSWNDILEVEYVGYYLDENGDIVIENGKEKTFDSSTNAKFFIGSNLTIDGFEEGFVGMRMGEEKCIYCTFPSNYGVTDLAGQKALFKVTVKGFFEAPEYNDDFVKNNFDEYSSVEELEMGLRKSYILNRVFDGYIIKNAKITSYPEKEYAYMKAQMIDVGEEIEDLYGISIDQYLQYFYGMTLDEYIKSNMETEMIYYALKNIFGENAEPTVDEISQKREDLIERYKKENISDGMSEEEAYEQACKMVDSFEKSYVYEEVLFDKIDNLLVEKINLNIIHSEKDYSWEIK